MEEPRHAGTTWSGTTTEEKVPRQVRTRLIARRSDMPYSPKDCEQKVKFNEVISKNAGLNIDRETVELQGDANGMDGK
ncbi:hypothetical protein TNCV_2378901 [Trichonephila clavipes]|uniref:Uncharacterized protein n=1 Tax=Trichonephila clavipes TaxID=2585209 RepID=A0A8X6V4K2_TRICX|nr:hypothetical protein TNCV_2378901 [Trichonephila clavipes]